MDPVTHAASGAVAMLALRNRPATAMAVPLAALACASPDIDLVFINTPLEFLLLHRGITHSLSAMPIFGFVLALLCRPLWRRTTPGCWRLTGVWIFCCAMILLHIWLDVVTTYGTMIFLPFSHYRVRLNSIYIIDLLVTVPLLWAIWRWRARRALLLLVFGWTFFYPAAGIAINAWHEGQWKARFMNENQEVTRLHVLPDAFAPFFWRVIYEQPEDTGLTVRELSINVLGNPRNVPEVHPAADPQLVERLSSISLACEVYFNFAVLPVMENLRTEDSPPVNQPDSRMLMFYDLRFGSGLQFVRKILAMRPNADIPFQLMAVLGPEENAHPDLADLQLRQIRLRFSDSGRDSGWHSPEPPRKPDLMQWLVGLR